MFDIFPAFHSNSLPFSSPDISHGAAVFQLCKICVLNQPNALVLIAKCDDGIFLCINLHTCSDALMLWEASHLLQII